MVSTDVAACENAATLLRRSLSPAQPTERLSGSSGGRHHLKARRRPHVGSSPQPAACPLRRAGVPAKGAATLAAAGITAVFPIQAATLPDLRRVPQKSQVTQLRDRADIVVTCPWRLADLIEQGHCHRGGMEIGVLDEADHMAGLGFLSVVQRLLDTPPSDGQRMLFSAMLDAAIDVLAWACIW